MPTKPRGGPGPDPEAQAATHADQAGRPGGRTQAGGLTAQRGRRLSLVGCRSRSPLRGGGGTRPEAILPRQELSRAGRRSPRSTAPSPGTKGEAFARGPARPGPARRRAAKGHGPPRGAEGQAATQRGSQGPTQRPRQPLMQTREAGWGRDPGRGAHSPEKATGVFCDLEHPDSVNAVGMPQDLYL